MRPGERKLTIDGLPCIARDIGCADFSRAARNRQIVKERLFTDWWVQMESALAHTPKNAPLPAIVRLGNIPEHRTPNQGFSRPFEDEEEDRQF